MFDLPFLIQVRILNLHILSSSNKNCKLCKVYNSVNQEIKKHFGNFEQRKTQTAPKEDFFSLESF